jgi:hypothetical protein
MPGIGTLYHPSSPSPFSTIVLTFFLTSPTDVRYVPSIDSCILNLLEIVPFVKAQVLQPAVFQLIGSFDYNTVESFYSSLHVMDVGCSGDNYR